MWIWTACIFLGCVRVCASPSPAVSQFAAIRNKTNEWRHFAKTLHAQQQELFVSYLKGLNVNRLLLAIVFASAPPIIIFQNERPLTSLLTCHHGTSGDQTFSPRPIQKRCSPGLFHTDMYSGEKMSPTFIQDVQFDVSGNEVWCFFFPASDKQSEHELKSPQVVSIISL